MGMFDYLSSKPGYGPIAEGVAIFGYNRDVDTGDMPYTLRFDKGAPYPWDLPPATLSVYSDDTSDNEIGSGGRTVLIQGLDENGKELHEILTLQGVLPVQTVGTFSRLNRMSIDSVGLATVNEGTICAENDGQKVGCIGPAAGSTNMSKYSIPMDWLGGAVMVRAWGSIADKNSGTTLFQMRIRQSPDKPWHAVGVLSAAIESGIVDFTPQAPIRLAPGADIDLQALDSNKSSLGVAAGFDILRVLAQDFPRLVEPAA